jgi:hypothetical protein
MYCSEACRDEHFSVRGHRLLCVGPVPEAEAAAHPLVQFKLHAGEGPTHRLLYSFVVWPEEGWLRQPKRTRSSCWWRTWW